LASEEARRRGGGEGGKGNRGERGRRRKLAASSSMAAEEKLGRFLEEREESDLLPYCERLCLLISPFKSLKE
jgi:hypothetical protein